MAIRPGRYERLGKRHKKNVIWISRGLFGSQAYRAMIKKSPTSAIVLGLLWERRKMEKKNLTTKPGKRQGVWVITNNGEIELPYRYLKQKYNIGESTYSRAIQAAEKFGFIEVTKTPGKHGEKSLFSLVDRWKNYGQSGWQAPPERSRKPINGGFRKGNKHGRKFTAKIETTAVDER